MKLEDQVCSLELARKLKELGVKQESYFIWYGGTTEPTLWGAGYFAEKSWSHPEQTYSACTVAELGEMLPQEIKSRWLAMLKSPAGWSVGYGIEFGSESDNLSDAMADMLVYLLDNKLV